MLLDPWMIGTALEGDIQRDLQTAFGRGIAQHPKVLDGPQFGGDRGVAPGRGADGPGDPGVVLTRPEPVVGTFAGGGPYGVDRRQVEHIEAHVGHIAELFRQVDERAGISRLYSPGTWEQLVPRGEAGSFPVDHQPETGRHRRHRPVGMLVDE